LLKEHFEQELTALKDITTIKDLNDLESRKKTIEIIEKIINIIAGA
jgi:hypothetical protein